MKNPGQLPLIKFYERQPYEVMNCLYLYLLLQLNIFIYEMSAKNYRVIYQKR